MMIITVIEDLKKVIQNAFSKIWTLKLDLDSFDFQNPPNPDQGDLALPCFTWAKRLKIQAPEIAKTLSQEISSPWIDKIEVKGPYLNIFLNKEKYFSSLLPILLEEDRPLLTFTQKKKEKILLEYSSPNTNKPLHLGHVRNNALGMALGNLLKSMGHEVLLVNLVNDRGIHICKSMVAYQKWGKGETPKTAGMKGDHFVGKFYVMFDQELKKERHDFFKQKGMELPKVPISKEEWALLIEKKGILDKNTLNKALESPKPLDQALMERGALTKKEKKVILELKKEEERKRKETLKELEKEFESQSSLLFEAAEMLRKWEEGDPQVRKLWETMNQWVYEGFKETYQRLGCHFDIWNYESQTYLLGKKIVEENLGKGIFYKKEDGSVWAKLDGSRNGFPLKDKLVLRRDGTSVYITQDLGTAIHRMEKYKPHRMIYVVASEQNLHFATLFEMLERMGYEWANRCYHAAYGMVTLPQGRGKLKSREGTAVDADQLLDDLEERCGKKILENGYYETEEDLKTNASYIALGALKFFILQVHPQKDVHFDPEKAISFQGDTGPYIQYSYARIRSIWRKSLPALQKRFHKEEFAYHLLRDPAEWELAKLLSQYSKMVEKSAMEFAPSFLAHYLLDIAKAFSRFYHNCKILQAETEELQAVRLALAMATARILKEGLAILGIPVPERM
ncbi:MAG: arginine--tRNA ligase [Planctomycetota bacterium]|nr:MAG: arginine--tRNA ligase [Planctomycetota bacterium]